MKLTKKPMVWAYVTFLLICTVIHIIMSACSLPFPAWPKIVLAATVASYMFSFSAFYKSCEKSDKKMLSLLIDYKRRYKKLAGLLGEKIKQPGIKEKHFEEEKEIQASIDKLVSEKSKIVLKDSKKSFRYDFVGFLLFFCILVINPLETLLFDCQDVLTVAAFAVVLLTELFEDIQYERREKMNLEIIEKLEEQIKFLEDEIEE